MLTNFDVLAQADGAPNKALDRTFTTTVTDGTLTINFTSVADVAKANAIEIVSQ